MKPKVPSFRILHQEHSHLPSGWEGVCLADVLLTDAGHGWTPA